MCTKRISRKSKHYVKNYIYSNKMTLFLPNFNHKHQKKKIFNQWLHTAVLIYNIFNIVACCKYKHSCNGETLSVYFQDDKQNRVYSSVRTSQWLFSEFSVCCFILVFFFLSVPLQNYPSLLNTPRSKTWLLPTVVTSVFPYAIWDQVNQCAVCFAHNVHVGFCHKSEADVHHVGWSVQSGNMFCSLCVKLKKKKWK